MTRRRWMIWVGGAVAAAVIVVVIGYFLILPWVARREIVSALNSAGVEGVRFDLRRVTPWNLQLNKVEAGKNGAGRIGGVTARYSPSGLWHGRIGDLRLTGVELVLAVHNGQIETGDLWQPKPPASSSTTSAGPDRPQALHLPFDRVDLESSTVSLELPGNTVRVPAQGSLVRQDDGRFRVELDAMVGKPLKISGTIGPNSGDIDLTVDGQGLDVATLAAVGSGFSPGSALSGEGGLNLHGSAHWAGGGGTVAASLEPDAVSLTVAHGGNGAPATNIQGIGGVFQGEASFVPGEPSTGKLTIRKAGFSGPQWDLAVDGLNGGVAFDDLRTLLTQAEQKLDVAKLKVGKMEFTGGSLAFRLDGPRTIRVTQTQWNWLGGKILAKNFRIDPMQPVLDATVQVREVDMHQLLAFFIPDKATGEGKISGQVPVTIVKWPDIHFGHGMLSGGDGGTLKIKDLATMATALEQSQRLNAEVKQSVLEALGDFKFNLLKAEVLTMPDGLKLYVYFYGKGRTGGKQGLDVEFPIFIQKEAMWLYFGLERWLSSHGQGQ